MNAYEAFEILSIATQLVNQAGHEDDKGNSGMANALRHWAYRLRVVVDNRAARQDG